MIKRKRVVAAAVLLLLALVSGGCEDKDLERLSQALQVTAESMAVLQKTVISANATVPPLISNEAAGAIMRVSLQVNLATKEAIQATRNVAKLDPTSKTKLVVILAPVIAAVDRAVADPTILGISDQKTRDTVRASLVSIQTTLAVAQAISQRSMARALVRDVVRRAELKAERAELKAELELAATRRSLAERARARKIADDLEAERDKAMSRAAESARRASARR